MAVNVSGSVVASLLYDQAQSDGHQMGFLTGQVVSHMTDTISDSQINNYEVETKVYIYGSVSCPRDQRFYSNRGEILTAELQRLMQKKTENIVGWYSFRRNSTMRPSLMERRIHENLLQLKRQDSNHFLFLLCTSRASTNKSTHSFDHCFCCLQHRSFQRKLVNVINLGDTTHMEYKTLPSHTASNNQGVYNMVVKQQEGKFLDDHGFMEVRQIQSLNGALSRKLEEMSEEVAISEDRLSSLEEEIRKYRKQVRLKTLEKEQKQSSAQVTKTAVPKKPSVDDILFMDTNNGDATLTLQVDSQRPHTSETVPKIEIGKPGDTCEPVQITDDSSGKTQLKAEIKLTAPASLHNRSNSLSDDKSFTQSSINASDNIHVRSKSADIANENPKGTGKASGGSDPFSFVSSMMAQSRQTDDKISDRKDKNGIMIEQSVPSGSVAIDVKTNVNERSSRQRSRNAEAASNVAKSIKESTRAKNKSAKDEKQSFISTGKDVKDHSESHDINMEVDTSDSEKGGRLTNSIGSKTCSQEAGKRAVVSDHLHSDDSASQDTLDMDVSSSPIY